jgi:zinc-ribbon domain
MLLLEDIHFNHKTKEKTMALIKCKKCGKEVSMGAQTCSQCGAPVATTIASTALVSLVVLGGFLWIPYSVFFSGSATTPAPHNVTYYVEGMTSAASLTYENAQGEAQQEEVRVPWQTSFETKRGSFLYLSAKNKKSYGDVTVRITVDGKEFKRSDEKGGYTIANTSGSCCE